MFTIPYVSCVMCHVSRVTCHVSRVTCHVSHVTCHMSCVTKKVFFFVEKNGKSGEASRSRVCYQRGLPRLVSKVMDIESNLAKKSAFCKGVQSYHKESLLPIGLPCLVLLLNLNIYFTNCPLCSHTSSSCVRIQPREEFT